MSQPQVFYNSEIDHYTTVIFIGQQLTNSIKSKLSLIETDIICKATTQRKTLKSMLTTAILSLLRTAHTYGTYFCSLQLCSNLKFHLKNNSRGSFYAPPAWVQKSEIAI